MSKLCRFIVTAPLVAVSLMAGPSGNVSLSYLIQQANTIVVGDITGGSDTGPVITVDITAVRVLQGNIAPGTGITVQWQAPANRRPAPTVQKRTGMFFLRAAGAAVSPMPVVSGPVSALDLFVPVASGTLPGPYVYQASTRIADKVTAELGA